MFNFIWRNFRIIGIVASMRERCNSGFNIIYTIYRLKFPFSVSYKFNYKAAAELTNC